MKKYGRTGSRFFAVGLLILAFVLAFSGCTAFAVRPADTGETGTDTTAPATTGSGEKEPSGFVALLLADETVPAFNQTVIENLHFYYSHYYIGDLGTDAELAASTAEFYAEYRDLIDESDKDEVTDLLCESYLAAAGDKYAYYMNPEALAEHNSDMAGTYVGIGVQVTNDSVARTVTVIAVFPDTPAFEAGVLPGDLIEGVGDTSADEISFAELVNRIRGEEGTDVTVSFSRNGEIYTRTMTRRKVTQITASGTLLPDVPKIGMIRITEFDGTTYEQFAKALNALLDADGDGLDENGDGEIDPDIDGLIFDVRDNPGGLLNAILAVLNIFVPDGTPLASYEYYDGSTSTTVAQTAQNTRKLVFPSEFPISVLCNENTASAGELFTCAMQDFGKEGLLNVTVVGVVTFGKGTMQWSVELPQGRASTISVAYYNPPYSGNYEGVGITPDLVVELSEEAKRKSIYALTDEEDVQMSAAINSVSERVVSE